MKLIYINSFVAPDFPRGEEAAKWPSPRPLLFER